jgi:hypothetical protein
LPGNSAEVEREALADLIVAADLLLKFASTEVQICSVAVERARMMKSNSKAAIIRDRVINL